MLSATTLLVPTYNRSIGLRRLLTHLVNSGLDAETEVHVLDSSSFSNVEQNTVTCKEFGSKLNILHKIFPDTTVGFKKFTIGVESVTTEFLLFCPDDDFPILSTIQNCEAFLLKNPDYVGCHGFYVSFLKFTDGFRLEEDSFNPGRDEATPEERVWNQFHSYAHLFYSLRRPEALRYSINQVQDLMEALPSMTEGGGIGEMAEAMFYLMKGKVKRLPMLQFIRNGLPTQEDGFRLNFIFGPHFSPSLSIFNQFFSKSLSEATGRSIPDCDDLFRSGFSAFFIKVLQGKCLLPQAWKQTLLPYDSIKTAEHLELLLKEFHAHDHKEVPLITSLINEFPLPIDFAPAGAVRNPGPLNYLLTGKPPLVLKEIARGSDGWFPRTGCKGLSIDGWCAQQTTFTLGPSSPGDILTISWVGTPTGKEIAVEVQINDEPSIALSLTGGVSVSNIPIQADHSVTTIDLRFETASILSPVDPRPCSILLDSVRIMPNIKKS